MYDDGAKMAAASQLAANRPRYADEGSIRGIASNPFEAMEDRIAALTKQIDEISSRIRDKSEQLMGAIPENEVETAPGYPSVSRHGGQIGNLGARIDVLTETVSRLERSTNRFFSL